MKHTRSADTEQHRTQVVGADTHTAKDPAICSQNVNEYEKRSSNAYTQEYVSGRLNITHVNILTDISST